MLTRLIEILISLAIVAVLFVIVGLVLPSHRHLSKDVETNRKLTIVYDTLNSLKRFKDWNVVPLRDPRMAMKLSGPESGKGARLDYDSDKPNPGEGSCGDLGHPWRSDGSGVAPRLRWRALQRLQPGLERFEAGASALEHARLGVELVAGHEIQLAEARPQDGSEISLEITLRRTQGGRQVIHQAAGDFIDPEGFHCRSSRLAPNRGATTVQGSK